MHPKGVLGHTLTLPPRTENEDSGGSGAAGSDPLLSALQDFASKDESPEALVTQPPRATWVTAADGEIDFSPFPQAKENPVQLSVSAVIWPSFYSDPASLEAKEEPEPKRSKDVWFWRAVARHVNDLS